jgi:pantetheine-phosphate adenylyltransferase
VGVAIYAGTFDPITNGHYDIVKRAANMFDEVIVSVFDTPSKSLLFSTEERIDLCKRSIKDIPNVEVRQFNGLVADFASGIGADAMVRGLRSITDLDYEVAMVMMNRKLHPDVDTVFLYTSLEYQFVSSSLIKEVIQYGGDINSLVPEHVSAALKDRYGIKV